MWSPPTILPKLSLLSKRGRRDSYTFLREYELIQPLWRSLCWLLSKLQQTLSQQAICWKWILQIYFYPHKLFLCSFYYDMDFRKWEFRISLGVHHMGLAKWFLVDWLAFTQPLKWGLSLWTCMEKSAKIHCLWKGIKQFVWYVSICVKRKPLLTHTQTHWIWRVQGYQTYYLLLGRRIGGRGKMRNNFHSISFDIFGILKHVKILPVQKINKTLVLSN